MIRWKVGLVVSAICLILCTESNGDIVVNVDLSTKEFFFSGSDTGTLAQTGAQDGSAIWSSSSAGQSHIVDIASDVVWSGTGNAAGNLNQFALRSPGIYINFHVIGGGAGSGTFSFVGNRFSYAGVSEIQRNSLENLVTGGGVLNPSGSSSGFSAIRFAEVSSVPEPAAIWIAGLLASLITIQRRQRNNRTR